MYCFHQGQRAFDDSSEELHSEGLLEPFVATGGDEHAGGQGAILAWALAVDVEPDAGRDQRGVSRARWCRDGALKRPPAPAPRRSR
jgi:hypothetical protein